MSTRLERMRTNPKGDWTIADVTAICREHGLTFETARGGGSHCKVFHPALPGKALTVPARRPIKPVYIRKVVDLVDLVRSLT